MAWQVTQGVIPTGWQTVRGLTLTGEPSSRNMYCSSRSHEKSFSHVTFSFCGSTTIKTNSQLGDVALLVFVLLASAETKQSGSVESSSIIVEACYTPNEADFLCLLLQ